ncbi:macrophage mannose receptor 1 [Oncorhynchus tshawytscha]|uniref:Macrophage mannose receptor 1-like n=1 Tax=Oncorhynchus tshawytscha TaxID=74940 RepID=A0AAZ3QAF2_ONCTS|nr:macrophage mannose receptor 1 [Oncorhynchus tshawytscha]
MLLLLFTLCSLLSCAFSQCEEGWRAYEDKCYYFSTNTKSWDDARTDCVGRGSHLMSILDIPERTWVRTQVGTEIFWIGLNDIAAEGVWEWTDGSTFLPFLAYWKPGNPDNWEDNEDCGEVVGGEQGRWNDDVCTSRRKYICKRPNPNPPTMCDTANGWSQYGSNCYKLKTDTRKSWLGARHDCVRDGADLVSIASPEEEQYITGRLDDSFFDIWLGYTTLKCTTISCQVEIDRTQFSWSDASSGTYTNWGTDPVQPDLSEKQNGICVAVIKEAGQDFGKWKSHICRYERPYMCKRALNTICPPGWISFSGNCYWVVSNKMFLTSWHEAQQKCSSEGANLVTIKTQEEQYFINTHLPDLNQGEVPDVWIGVADEDQDGTFRWVDKTDITFSNWKPSFPKNTVNLWDCGQIYTGDFSGKWETTNCFKNLGYICKMVGGQNVKPTSVPDSHCDAGYLLYGDYCYHFETEMVKNWLDAESYCASQRGHLASFHTQEELSFITTHMPAPSWVGLSDSRTEGVWVWSDGTPSDFLPWAPNQPDNWQGNEDCSNIRGFNHHEAGLLNDEFCTSTLEFVCRKAKGQGPPPIPPTSGPDWNEKCGSWMSDPFNDYCYLFNYLSMRKWADARADCVNQKGDLLSITEPFEQAFIQSKVQLIPTGVSVWMGGHDSITEGGWEWTDASPFRYIHWNAGNPDNYGGEDCLSMLINTGYWNDDNCDYNRGYICKRRGNTPVSPPPHDGFETAYICEDSSAVLHCDTNSVINIQSAFFGRKSDKICPHQEGASGTCTVGGILPLVRKACDNRPFCFLYAYTETDPCPSISKYLEVVYSCEQNVCLRGLGVEDGNVTDSMLSASSSQSSHGPNGARLNGGSCWMPSNPLNSWIQVNLGEAKKITGVVIQGCPSADHWVTKFKIQHSMDGSKWTEYKDDGGVFTGCMDRNTPETQLLGTPVSAQYVRILPQEFNGQTGLRFDILGCIPDYAVSCDAKPNFNFANDLMTVHCPAGCAQVLYTVYGSGVYRGDSNICAAGIHAGVILNDIGGDCTMLKEPGQNFYSGSTKNGITSRQYDGNYEISYQFADKELSCSGPDWYEFGEFCYKPYGDKKTWHAARGECRKLGADLVSIQSMTEQSWLESYLYMATNDVWIGLNDMGFSGLFSWSDNHWVTFTYWAPGEPNNHQGFNEDCVEMFYQTGRWNDVPCTELNTYICKMPKAHYLLPSVMPTVYGCTQGWDAYGYSCYWMEETARTWSDAKAFCEQQNSKLLHIGDIYEQSHFTVKLARYTGLWWIGLRATGDSGGVDYIWDNGAPLTFTHWDRNQPDNHAGTCVAMTTGLTGGFWDDKPCTELFPFVCETPRPDITPPTKPPTPPPSLDCADGWTAERHFRNCYKLFMVDFSKKKSWPAAREDCISRGADLVSIHNMEEESFLSTYTKGKSKWIGLKHNPTDGGYHWSDATPVSHTNWGHGEPNNHEGREDCVEMVSNTNGTSSWWNDLNCDAHQDWICMISKGKKPIVPPVPPPPVPAPDCGTNAVWRKNNGICYYYNDTDIVDFQTAMSRCYDEKALLVSILNKDEQAYINTMIGTGRAESSWIGMVVFGIAADQYQWVDWSPVTYVFWGLGEPNNANGEEQCVQMNRHQGNWNDVNCARTNAGYLCKKYPNEDHTPPPPTQPWTGYCPAGWMLFRNKCFMFQGHGHGMKANWTSARSWCQSKGAELAVIDNQYENDFVSSYLRDLRLPTWIGLTDSLVEGGFGWSDGVSPVLYTNWADKEPNNNGGREHCTAITHNYLVSGRWNDDLCTEEHSWVCSMKKSSSIAPPAPTKNPCPSGYISWYKNCYKLVEEPKTWEAAQVACEQEGGNLASVDMSYDQAFVAGVVLQGKADAWIGLRRKDDSSSYTWTDGWSVFFTHWGPGEPSNHKTEGCVAMRADPIFHGTWNDTDCNSAKAYICKISSESPPPTPAPGDGKCLLGWVPFGRYCYFVYNGPQGFSWPEARHYCQIVRGDLVSIHSRPEVEFILKMNYTRVHNVWIGLTRDNNFGWSWTDMQSLAFLNWAPNEPNEAFHNGDVGGENCVEMYPDGQWNDNHCMQKRGYACRHRQYYTTDGGGIVIPTDAPQASGAGLIAGAVIGAIVVFTLIFGLLYYVFSIRGVKLSDVSFPTRTGRSVDVPAFNNPNFGGESET